MTDAPSPSILAGPIEKTLLNDVIEAMRHVDAIMAINDDATIAPGDLRGMSLVLRNAEKVLGEMRSALPAMHRRRRPPTRGSTAWQGPRTAPGVPG